MRVFLLVFAPVVALVVAGCGGTAYDSLINRRLDQLRASAPFRILWGPTTLDETGVSIRVPMAFRESYKPDSGHPDDNGRIKPERFQPPFLKLPGLKLCYEGKVADAAGGKVPFYCYLAAVPKGDAEKIAAQLEEQLKAKFPNTPADWENVDAKTPDDKAVSWRKLRVEGEQPFFVEGQPEAKVMPGIFEVWVHKADGYAVMVAWRAPKEIDTPITPATQNPASQMSANAKPDLQSMPALTAGTLRVEAVAEPAPDAAG